MKPAICTGLLIGTEVLPLIEIEASNCVVPARPPPPKPDVGAYVGDAERALRAGGNRGQNRNTFKGNLVAARKSRKHVRCRGSPTGDRNRHGIPVDRVRKLRAAADAGAYLRGAAKRLRRVRSEARNQRNQGSTLRYRCSSLVNDQQRFRSIRNSTNAQKTAGHVGAQADRNVGCGNRRTSSQSAAAAAGDQDVTDNLRHAFCPQRGRHCNGGAADQAAVRRTTAWYLRTGQPNE